MGESRRITPGQHAILFWSRAKKMPEDERKLVQVAINGKDGRRNYFELDTELPEGWNPCGWLDISDIMLTNHMTRVEALVMMNR